MKLGELANRLGAELGGDPNLEITGVKGIEEAEPAAITFVANPRYTSLARAARDAIEFILDAKGVLDQCIERYLDEDQSIAPSMDVGKRS